MLHLIGIHKNYTLKNVIATNSVEGKRFLVVAPDPTTADTVRRELLSVEKLVDVITISKFKKEIESRSPLAGYRTMTKTELMWNMVCFFEANQIELSYSSFQKVFESVTEYRSFNIKTDVISSICESEEKNFVRLVCLANEYINNNNIIDEHAFYFHYMLQLKGELCLEEMPAIVFVGFKNITAIQLDFLDALSIRHEVFVAAPSGIISEASEGDWIGWLRAKTNAQISPTNKEKLKADYVQVQKGQLNSVLSAMLKKFSGEICLATKQNSLEFIQEIPTQNFSFKQKIELFKIELKKSHEKVMELFQQSPTIQKIDFEKMVNIEIEKFKSNADLKKLRQLKIWQECDKILKSTSNTNINTLMVAIMFEMLELDLPRLTMSRMLKGEHLYSVYSLKDLSASDFDKDLIFILDEKYGDALAVERVLGREIEKKLKVIGPLKSARLENIFLREQIYNLLTRKNVTILANPEFLKTNLFWAEILRNVELNPIQLDKNITHEKMTPSDVFDMELPLDFSFSASSFQNLIDCPKKFYHQNLLKQNINYKNEFDATPAELGVAEHAIIQKYFELLQSGQSPNLENLIEEELEKLFQLKSSSKIIISQNELELRETTKNGVNLLLAIKSKFEIQKFQFEIPFKVNQGINKYSRFDCFAEQNGTVYIFDFKRSKSSIPSVTQIKTFEKIQILFYLNLLRDCGILRDGMDFVVGYLNLSEPKDSRVLSNNKMEKLRFDFCEINSSELQNLSQYAEFEKDKLSGVTKSQNFRANPRESSVCQYCFLKTTCDRGLIYA